MSYGCTGRLPRWDGMDARPLWSRAGRWGSRGGAAGARGGRQRPARGRLTAAGWRRPPPPAEGLTMRLAAGDKWQSNRNGWPLRRRQVPATLAGMVRPDEPHASRRHGGSSCTELAGESPVAASAGAPRSRPRATRETSASEWGVQSPRGAIRRHGGERVRRPSGSEPYSLVREAAERSGRPSRSCHGEGDRLHLRECPEGCRTPAG
jgi:hypothetical protein